jgi:hypothetical protein
VASGIGNRSTRILGRGCKEFAQLMLWLCFLKLIQGIKDRVSRTANTKTATGFPAWLIEYGAKHAKEELLIF